MENQNLLNNKKEISQSEFLKRRLAKEAGVNYKKIEFGCLDERDWARLTRAIVIMQENLNNLTEYWINKADELKKTR